MICCHIYVKCNHNGIRTLKLYSIPKYTYQCMQVSEILMPVCFYVLQLNYCQIFCPTYCLVLMYILNTLFRCLLVLHWLYFSRFSLHFSNIALFINLYNAFPSFSLNFQLLFFFRFLNSINCFNHCDWSNSNKRCSFLNFNPSFS